MKRFVAVLGLVVLPALGFARPADATGYGVCAITGTITFSSAPLNAGIWHIGAAVIDCQGLIAARRRIIGRGPFRGSGSFTALPSGAGGCVQQTATGKVEYRIPTTGGEIQVNEPVTLTLVGAGVMNTPQLNGLFELPPPYDGDCVTKSVGRTTFVAEVVLLRYPREIPPPLLDSRTFAGPTPGG